MIACVLATEMSETFPISVWIKLNFTFVTLQSSEVYVDCVHISLLSTKLVLKARALRCLCLCVRTILLFFITKPYQFDCTVILKFANSLSSFIPSACVG